MAEPATDQLHAVTIDRLKTPIRIWGFLAAPVSVWLVLRLVWEQTFLTWRSGPQMVGFTLAHNDVLLLLMGIASLWLLAAWFVVVAAWTIWALFQQRRIHVSRWLALAGIPLLFGLHAMPYGLWQRLFSGALAKSPHSAEFIRSAAARGDLGAVKSLNGHGVKVNATNSYGATALHAAAVGGKIHVVEYLLASGADINKRDDLGHTALDSAREMHRENVAQISRRAWRSRGSGDGK